MNRLVIGMTAHVDSGKTTLSEAMLYTAGELRRLGRVDHGNTFLDTDPIERSRGITVFSKQAVLETARFQITLLDTPGHVDFSAETERALRVMDYAVLVISGTDGVQSHTETLWRLLKRYNIPTFIFVNKMDISFLKESSHINELKRKLSPGCIDFNACREKSDLDEELAECSEELMNEYLENGVIPGKMIPGAIRRREVFPVIFGSALKLNGIQELLNVINTFSVQPEPSPEFGAIVYKITTDQQGNRLTHMKITGGSLKVKAQLECGGKQEKVNQIRIYSGAKFTTVDEAPAGTLCAVTGLSAGSAGEGLGFESSCPAPLLEPVLTYRMQLPHGTDIPSTLAKLHELSDEDPMLRIVWNEQLKEIHVQLMGEIQLEVLTSVIRDRFGLEVQFDQGSIAYKETIAAPVEGVGHYEPLRHYAEVHLLLEPGERGSGLQFFTDCRKDDLDINWQRLILTHLEEKTGMSEFLPVADNRHENHGRCRKGAHQAHRGRRFPPGNLPSRPAGTTLHRKRASRALVRFHDYSSSGVHRACYDRLAAHERRTTAAELHGRRNEIHRKRPCFGASRIPERSEQLHPGKGQARLHSRRIPPLPQCGGSDRGDRLRLRCGHGEFRGQRVLLPWRRSAGPVERGTGANACGQRTEIRRE